MTPNHTTPAVDALDPPPLAPPGYRTSYADSTGAGWYLRPDLSDRYRWSIAYLPDARPTLRPAVAPSVTCTACGAVVSGRAPFLTRTVVPPPLRRPGTVVRPTAYAVCSASCAAAVDVDVFGVRP